MPVHRLAAVSWCVLALAAPFASPAHAVAPQVAVAAGSQFVPPEIYVVEGGTLTFANLDPQIEHNLVSMDGSGFGSAIVPFGKTAEVTGVSSLVVSVYPFWCVLHENMRGNLHIEPAPKP